MRKHVTSCFKTRGRKAVACLSFICSPLFFALTIPANSTFKRARWTCKLSKHTQKRLHHKNDCDKKAVSLFQMTTLQLTASPFVSYDFLTSSKPNVKGSLWNPGVWKPCFCSMTPWPTLLDCLSSCMSVSNTIKAGYILCVHCAGLDVGVYVTSKH